MENAKFGSLNKHDYLKGLMVTVSTSVLTGIVTVMSTGIVPTLVQLKTMAIAGVAAGISYLTKNLLTNSNNELGKTEKKTDAKG